MELRELVRVLHQNWIVIVAMALVGLIGGAGASLAATATYESSARLFVSVRASENVGTGELAQGGSFARQAVTSYVDIVTSGAVRDATADVLADGTDPGELSGMLSASSPESSVLIDIVARAESGARAAQVANAASEALIQVVDDLERPTGATQSPVSVRSIQTATAPGSPASPRVPLNLAVGLLLGLVAGVGFAALRTVLDTRVRSQHDIESLIDAPLLGGVRYDPEASERPLIVYADPRSPRAESFRSLRTNLQFVNAGVGQRTFVISSAGPGEGKSTTTANLAIAIAETGASVVLIDGDLRRPRMADYMGIEGGVGLTDVLIGRARIDDVMQRWGRGQLHLLPAGRIPPNPSELLGSTAMSQVISTLGDRFDYVLIDAPPVLVVTDAAVVSRMTGGVILVAAARKTRKQEFAAASRAIEGIGSTISGAVVTMLPTRGPDSYSYGAYSYEADEELARKRARWNPFARRQKKGATV